MGLGAVVATSCINVDYPTVAFRCSPSQSDPCPETHVCCSDDPSARGGVLPNYLNKDIDGDDPFFSGVNNGLGTSGLCVRTGDIPVGSGLLEPAAANCPIPCNPRWDEDGEMGEGTIAMVCGANRVCCQTVSLEATDCFLDGDTWRPVTGADIGSGTMWENGRHATHQDPGGRGCTAFALALGGSGGVGDPIWEDCVENLTVADQRGFCMALQPGQMCPTDQPGFLNACDQINMGLIPPPVAGA